MHRIFREGAQAVLERRLKHDAHIDE
jgi:hypothetical protein